MPPLAKQETAVSNQSQGCFSPDQLKNMFAAFDIAQQRLSKSRDDIATAVISAAADGAATVDELIAAVTERVHGATVSSEHSLDHSIPEMRFGSTTPDALQPDTGRVGLAAREHTAVEEVVGVTDHDPGNPRFQGRIVDMQASIKDSRETIRTSLEAIKRANELLARQFPDRDHD